MPAPRTNTEPYFDPTEPNQVEPVEPQPPGHSLAARAREAARRARRERKESSGFPLLLLLGVILVAMAVFGVLAASASV